MTTTESWETLPDGSKRKRISRSHSPMAWWEPLVHAILLAGMMGGMVGILWFLYDKFFG